MNGQSATIIRPEQHFLIDGIDWPGYNMLLDTIGKQRVFITYDRGKVELMYPSFEHENRSELLATLIRSIADGLNLKVKSGGSTTFKREDLDRGLEPDNCFYIANEQSVRSKSEIDLAIDPPPDLCVEVEISNRLLDRTAIYAQLGVAELWRDDGKDLRLFLLSASGKYVETSKSLSFPTMTVKRLNYYLDRAHGMDEITWARKVRKASRKHRA